MDNGGQDGSAETNVGSAEKKAKYQEDKRCRQEESRRTETLEEFLRVQAAKEDFSPSSREALCTTTSLGVRRIELPRDAFLAPRSRNLERRNAERIGCPTLQEFRVRNGSEPDSVHEYSGHTGNSAQRCFPLAVAEIFDE